MDLRPGGAPVRRGEAQTTELFMPRSFTFDFAFDAPPTDVWRVVSDTDLIDGAIGNPVITYDDQPQPDGTTRRICRTRKMGFLFEYEELPFTWIHEQMYEFRREFTRGAFKTFVHRCTLLPRDDAPGCVVRTTFEFEPSPVLGLIAPWGVRKDLVNPYRKAFSRINDRLRANNTRAHSVILRRPVAMSELDQRRQNPRAQRVQEFAERARSLVDTPLLEKLQDAIESLPDEELRRMQPRAFARRWQAGFRETLNLFLAATRAGMLKMRWDVICPHCRGDKQNLASLAEVRERAFCPSCNIDFDVDLGRSLEAVFTPHPQVREVPEFHYCLGGPGTTPHIVYQKLFQPGEEHRFTIRLAPGRYRMRFTGEQAYRWIEVAPRDARTYTDRIDKGEGAVTVEVWDGRLAGKDRVVPEDVPIEVLIRNASSRRTVGVLESVEWAVDALSAAELVADQRFRDLFSNEVLAPGIKLAVEDATILFTDVVGSTALYNTLGDAKAFSLVRTHFDVLHEIVESNRGAIVKTIGDAIMAVFTSPQDALQAAAELHARTDSYVREHGHGQGVQLKVGLHAGPCIAVTLNERLDYFGTAVNLAARVQAMSAGGDILVSRALAERTGGCESLSKAGWHSTEEQAQAKGFNNPVPVLRWQKQEPGAQATG